MIDGSVSPLFQFQIVLVNIGCYGYEDECRLHFFFAVVVDGPCCSSCSSGMSAGVLEKRQQQQHQDLWRGWTKISGSEGICTARNLLQGCNKRTGSYHILESTAFPRQMCLSGFAPFGNIIYILYFFYMFILADGKKDV